MSTLCVFWYFGMLFVIVCKVLKISVFAIIRLLLYLCISSLKNMNHDRSARTLFVRPASVPFSSFRSQHARCLCVRSLSILMY